jgi:hypothetical protein
MSPYFQITRGCRQGDPISPYLFILCVEVLAILIRQNNDIKGITMGNLEYLLAQFADDTTLILDGSEKCLFAVLNTLKFFERFSGLKVNADKTKLLWIGAKKRSRQKLCKEWNFDWTQNNFTLLGIKFDIDLKNMTNLNYMEQIKKIEMEMKLWSSRILTPLGRNTILKSLLLPKLNHLFASLPDPPESMIKELQKSCFKFVWQGKPDKVKRNVMIQPPKLGGISVPLIAHSIQSQKIAWMKKLFMVKHKWTHYLFQYVEERLIWLMDCVYIQTNIIPKCTNLFWKDVLQAWIAYINQCKALDKNDQSLLSQSIWFNDNIQINNQALFQNGIIRVSYL